MKKYANKILLVTIALASFSTLAQGRSSYVRIDLSRKFANSYLNLMGDENYGAVGADILLRGIIQNDFTVTLKADRADIECRLVRAKVQRSEAGTLTVVRVRATPEVDDGSECNVMIKYRTGQHATFTMFATGG